jgi:hypothetical protein
MQVVVNKTRCRRCMRGAMKNASLILALVVLTTGGLPPPVLAGPRCIADVCCPKETKAFSKKPVRLPSNWTVGTPCCLVKLDSYVCQKRVPISGKK